MAYAKAWALRCQLEYQIHKETAWTTLTYDETHKPVTLDKKHLSGFIKRLRQATNKPIRFFASGEYGEQNDRPHYHAIIYGLAHKSGADCIKDAWTTGRPKNEPLGFTETEPVTPARIAYTAGYTAKKIGFKRRMVEQVDPETGELYTWQPPFIQMSNRPGIGAHAKQWLDSWRLYAVTDGHKMAVPRYLHEAWKAQATEEEKELLDYEKAQLALTRNTIKTKEALEQLERTAVARQRLSADRRKY